jgi:hypothetical protein
MKAIINAARDWVSAFRRNPEASKVLQPSAPLNAETATAKVRHVAPLMNWWGHSLQWMRWEPDNRGLRQFYGHFPNRGLSVGDWVVQEMSTGRWGVLEIVEIEWKTDPEDMFFGYAMDVGFLPDGVDPKNLCRPKAPSPSDPDMLRLEPDAVTSRYLMEKHIGG